ncbi:MAG: DUF2437 domain-containing protein [Aeriscardovia sp.]|nr:DUF2437 domain-containing protein [Aeriscardovia sp.]
MKIARFVKGDGLPEYGFVQEDGGKKILAEIAGNPFSGDVTLSGERCDLADVRLLAPNFPLKIFCCDAFEDFYLKPATAAVGPDDILSLPAWSRGIEIHPGVGIIAASTIKNCPVSEVEKHLLGMTCVLDSTAISDRGGVCNTAFDDSLAIGPWVESKIDPDTRLIFGQEEPLDVRELLKCAIKNIAFISTFSTLLPGDMVVVRGRLSKRMDLGGEAKVAIEGLGYLKAYVRKEDSKPAKDFAGN